MKNESFPHCEVLLIGTDMEWNHAYLISLKKSFVVREHTCDQVWQSESLFSKRQIHLVVLIGSEDMKDVIKLRELINQTKNPPTMLVVTKQDNENYLKQGADFVTLRADVHGAIKYSRLAMDRRLQQQQLHQAEQRAKVLDELNQAIYRDAADPICYIQDGLFMDANDAFLREFEVEDREKLHDLTLLSLTTPKAEKLLKDLLKTVNSKQLKSSEMLDMQTLGGEKKPFNCIASPIIYEGEPAVQMLWRGSGSGGGGGISTDKTTGLMSFPALQQTLDNERQQNPDAESLGIWTYLWLENYRDVWTQDGHNSAEILMKSVSEGISRYLPPNTIAIRYNDDGLILYLHGERNEAIERLENMIKHVQEQVPENIGRLVHPSLYAAVEVITPSISDEKLLSSSFRAARSLSLGQSQDRVTTASAGKISRNDERRLAQLKQLLTDGKISVQYQPVNHLEADGVPRFALCLNVEDATGEDGEQIEFDTLIGVAERHGQAKVLDELKINAFLRDILSYDGDQKKLKAFVPLSGQSLNEEQFAQWTLTQLKETGISAQQMVFEISIDVAINAFSGAQRFAKVLQKEGGQIAVTEVSRFDDEIKDILERLKPNVLKLDMREIDTFEDEEESRFMNAVKEYAEAHKQTIIVDHMESPAQLSRVWPYDLQLLQGNGMVAPLPDFNFDFTEPLF